MERTVKYYTKVQFVSSSSDPKTTSALRDGTYIAEDGWTVISVQQEMYTYIITLQKPVNSDEVLRTGKSLDE